MKAALAGARRGRRSGRRPASKGCPSLPTSPRRPPAAPCRRPTLSPCGPRPERPHPAAGATRGRTCNDTVFNPAAFGKFTIGISIDGTDSGAGCRLRQRQPRWHRPAVPVVHRERHRQLRQRSWRQPGGSAAGTPISRRFTTNGNLLRLPTRPAMASSPATTSGKCPATSASPCSASAPTWANRRPERRRDRPLTGRRTPSTGRERPAKQRHEPFDRVPANVPSPST